MVGRLVQHQQLRRLCPGHDAGQGRAQPLAARQFSSLAVGLHIAEQKARQSRPRRIGRAPRVQPQPGIDERFVRIQHDRLLIQQGRPNRQLDRSYGRLDQPRDQLQQGRLAGAVGTGHGDPFRPSQTQGDRPQQPAAIIGHHDRLVQVQHHTSRRQPGRRHGQRHLAHAFDALARLHQIALGRLAFAFRQPLTTRARFLGPLGLGVEQDLGIGAVGARRLGRAVTARLTLLRHLRLTLDPTDSAFRLFQIAFGGGPLGVATLDIQIPAAAMHPRAQTGKLDDAVHATQQGAIVADQHHPARPVGHDVGDHGAGLGVQMIGRLVQHQQVRRRQLQPRQPQARLFAAAQLRRMTIQRQIGQTDLDQSRLHPLFQRPVRLGHVVQRTFARQHAMQDGQRRSDTQRLGDRLIIARRLRLRQPANRSCACDHALSRFGQTSDKAQQRGLAHAVATHDGRAFAPEGERQIVEEASAVRRAGRDAVERHERGCGPAWAWVERGHRRARAAAWKGRNRFPGC
ncbi:hypothetical protein D3C73_757620 [compost metagenome]